MSTAHILKNKSDKLNEKNIINEDEVMSPSNNKDDDNFVNKEYCSLQHRTTNEKLDELISITKKLNKLIVGNGEKGLLERQNIIEEKVNNHIKDEKESEEKVKKTIFDLIKTFTPYLIVAGGGGTMVKVLDILQSYFSS